MIKNLYICLLAVVVSGCAHFLPGRTPSDSRIKKILEKRIDVYKQSVGTVVGVIDGKGRRMIAYGKMDRDSGKPVDGNTIYEIGSMSKVFTALILADMCVNGEINLDDPIANYLPSEISMPRGNNQKITLDQLTTHTSGLPRMPDNISLKNGEYPGEDYSVEQMLAFIEGYFLPRAPGEKYEYSNLGVGLLGYLLSRKAGMTYEALLSSRILRPLGLNDTCITVPAVKQDRFATGHDINLHAVNNQKIQALAGATGIRSTANDILDFLAANMEPDASPLSQAVRVVQSVWIDWGALNVLQGRGWQKLRKHGTEILFHGGRTEGYYSFMGFDPVKKKAVVVLSNASKDISDIGIYILSPKTRLEKLEPPGKEKEIKTGVYTN